MFESDLAGLKASALLPFALDFQARKHVLRKNLDAKRLIPAINSTRVFGSGTAVEVTVTLPL